MSSDERERAELLTRLVKSGIPLNSQSKLIKLKNSEFLKELMDLQLNYNRGDTRFVLLQQIILDLEIQER